MQDTKHAMNENGLFTIAIKNGDIEIVEGLETACLVSLFTDARLDESEMIKPIQRGGWVGNVFSGRQLGGKLYTLEQSRITTAYIGKSKELAARSFDWMINDGVSRGVSNRVSIAGNAVNHFIAIVGRDGVKYDYRYLWMKTRPFNLRPA